jgi:hypothetical protein
MVRGETFSRQEGNFRRRGLRGVNSETPVLNLQTKIVYPKARPLLKYVG